MLCFFVKQKTAYERRISDWSSDVCSSDLGLEQITEAAEAGAGEGFAGIAAAYLRPEVAEARRLLAELHLASRRDQRLAHLLGEWHQTEAARAAALLGDSPGHPAATDNALFPMLLGPCHLEDLPSLQADPEDLGWRTSPSDADLPPPTTNGPT